LSVFTQKPTRKLTRKLTRKMTVTTSFEVFRQRMIDNGSLKKTIEKRTHDKIITYDPNTNKLSYQMILCLGLLPNELVDDKLIEPIYKYNHMKVMKNDILEIPKDRRVECHFDPYDDRVELDVPIPVLIDTQLNVLKDKMFDKCSYKHLTNVSNFKKLSLLKFPESKFVRQNDVISTCHCNHKNGNQCLRHSKEYDEDVEERMSSLYNIKYGGFPGVHLRMCRKHLKEWNENPLSHKEQMIQNQLDNLGFRINDYGYLLR
jgi:hypothetical protein